MVGAAGGECLELGRLWKRLSFFNPAVDWPATGRHSNTSLMFEVKRGAQKLTGENLLGRVFNCKLGCFVMCAIVWPLYKYGRVYSGKLGPGANVKKLFTDVIYGFS